MEAYISKMEFIRTNKDNCYWRLTFVDGNNNYIGTYSNPNISDEINFRKQTFGILSACNCYDLLNLSSNDSIPLSIFFKKKPYGGVEALINQSGQLLSLGEGIYETEKVWNIFNKKRAIKSYESGEIRSISSGSGCFSIWIKHAYYSTFYVTGQVYYGFGFPITIGLDATIDDIKRSSKLFTSFIESILKLYDTNDLLDLSRNKNNFPKVNIDIDDLGNITSIYNQETGMTLTEQNSSYHITKENRKGQENNNFSKKTKMKI